MVSARTSEGAATGTTAGGRPAAGASTDDRTDGPADDASAFERAEAESLAPAVTRAAAILDVLAEDPSVVAGPSELARRLGLPPRPPPASRPAGRKR